MPSISVSHFSGSVQVLQEVILSFTIRFEGLKVAGAGFVFIQVSAFRLSCIVGKDYVTGTFMDY